MHRGRAGVPVVALFGALVASACLSAPTPANRDGGGGSIDAGIDGGPDADIGPGMSFPPAGTQVTITGGWSGDLNRDGADDLLLASDTGDAATTGVYVLFGRSGERLTRYDAFLPTGRFRPKAVIGTNLDDGGNLDVVVYGVDFGTTAGGDEEAELLAFVAGDDGYGDALVNSINAATSEAWKAPFDPEFPLTLFAARIDPAKRPSIIVAHERGSFILTLSSWTSSAFELTLPGLLWIGDQGVTGGGAVANADDSSVDDVVIWTDSAYDVAWLVNDGSGDLTLNMVNGASGSGARLAAIYDLDATPPAEVVRLEQTALAAFPIDSEAGTAGGLLDGQNYIDGVADTTAMLVFEADGSDPRPEIVLSGTACNNNAAPPCLVIVRNAYLDGTSGNLLAGSGVIEHNLPSAFQPGAMFRGDFDDDDVLEVVVFDAAGNHECARVTATAASCD